MNSLLLLSLILCSCCLCFMDKVFVENGEEFVNHLCNLNSSTDAIVLYPAKQYNNVTSKTFCVINRTRSLSIRSHIPSRQANVLCHKSDSVPWFGAIFINMTITISDVVFVGCGLSLEAFPNSNFINSTIGAGKYFSHDHYAVLIFIGGQVNLTRTIITNYYGFAIIAINPLEHALFDRVSISHSSSCSYFSNMNRSLGSGVIVMYDNESSVEARIAEFINCSFIVNCDLHFSTCTPTLMNGVVPYSSSLTLLSYGVTYNLTFVVSTSLFVNNLAVFKSGLLIDLVDTNTTSVMINASSNFTSNLNEMCSGAALSLHMSSGSKDKSSRYNSSPVINPLTVKDTIFLKNSGRIGDPANFISFRQGTVYVGIDYIYGNIQLSFSNVTFRQNFADNYSSCIFVDVYSFTYALVDIVMHDIVAHNNSQTSFYTFAKSGLFHFVNVRHVMVKGVSEFCDNIGSIIRCDGCYISLHGDLTFIHNSGWAGAVLHVWKGLISFTKGLVMAMKNNRAERFGGAIYVYNLNYHDLPLCGLQFESNTSIVTSNNTAELSGNLAYIYPAYNCRMPYLINEIPINMTFYAKHLNFNYKNQSKNEKLTFSTEANQIEVNWSSLKSGLHYPGEKIVLNMFALDVMGNHVYSCVNVALIYNEGTRAVRDSKKVGLRSGEHIQIINEDTKQPSKINVTVHVFDCKVYKKISVFISSTTNSQSPPFKLALNITSCPPGFSLSRSGTCECSYVVHSFFSLYGYYNWEYCNINRQSISMPRGLLLTPWMGMYNGTFGISAVCPLGLCHSTFNHEAFQYNINNGFQLLNRADKVSPICLHDRTGIICGECADVLSVVFGSGECRKCSNWWLWTVILYIVAGPLLICALYMLRMTVNTGTLNGVIFFAQIAQVGLLEVFYYFESYLPPVSRVLLVFISLVNLNLGFPLCFFDGMDEVWKAGLSIVFPVYLVLIVVVMIIVGRFCHNRFSNRFLHSCVQILITIVHLSLSKLLIATIDVSTPVTVCLEDNSTHAVWFRNGSESFGFENGKLVSLMVVTTLVTGLFLVPYMITLFGGKLLTKAPFRAKYFRLAYESIHAPYRENRRYWLACRFLLQMSMYLLHAIFHTSKLPMVAIVSLPLLMAFVIIQVYLRPFKSKAVNLLDSFIMSIQVLMYIVGWYIILHYFDHNIIKKSVLALVLLTFVIFVLFVLIVVYHIAVVTTLYDRLAAVWRIRRLRRRLHTMPASTDEKQSLLVSEEVDSTACCRSGGETATKDYL